METALYQDSFRRYIGLCKKETSMPLYYVQLRQRLSAMPRLWAIPLGLCLLILGLLGALILLPLLLSAGFIAAVGLYYLRRQYMAPSHSPFPVKGVKDIYLGHPNIEKDELSRRLSKI